MHAWKSLSGIPPGSGARINWFTKVHRKKTVTTREIAAVFQRSHARSFVRRVTCEGDRRPALFMGRSSSVACKSLRRSAVWGEVIELDVYLDFLIAVRAL
jgi:hypothetical protein